MPRKNIRYNPDVLIEVKELRDRGVPWRDACKRLRVSKTTYYLCLKEIEKMRQEHAFDAA